MQKKTTNTKTKVSYSVDIDVLKRFNELAEREGYNKSQVVNNLIKKFVEEKRA